MTAKTTINVLTSLGVGDGRGQKFVYGDYDSIKAMQSIIFERDAALRRILPLLRRIEEVGGEVDKRTYDQIHKDLSHNGEVDIPDDAIVTVDMTYKEYKKLGQLFLLTDTILKMLVGPGKLIA